VNQANGSIVGYFLGPLLLRQENNVRRVYPLKVSNMEVIEIFNDPHDIHFDDAPTLLEKGSGETVGTGGFIGRHLRNSFENFLFREWIINDLKGHISKV
jgi:hypothetical protein